MDTCTWVGACSGQYGSVIPRGVGSLILRSSQDYMCSVLCLSLWVLCNANVYVSVYVTWLWSIGCYVSMWVWFCVCYVYYVNIVCMYHVFSKWRVYKVCAEYLVKKRCLGWKAKETVCHLVSRSSILLIFSLETYSSKPNPYCLDVALAYFTCT